MDENPYMSPEAEPEKRPDRQPSRAPMVILLSIVFAIAMLTATGPEGPEVVFAILAISVGLATCVSYLVRLLS